MIRLLQGTVHSTDSRTIILFVNGVGYQIYVPIIESIKTDEEITLHIHSHIREDAFTLYGFQSINELNFFELLLKINGVGPKMALEILKEPAEHIKNAIASSNIPALTKISGVGKKTAERIILELKNKVDAVESSATSTNSYEPEADVITALESLGYKRKHISKVLSEISDEITDVEELIRMFLQRV